MPGFSPMMTQYFQIKEQNKDNILFFRLGDFYEMFYEDALLASKELELTLTGRDCGLEERAPMCGVPHHSCEAYIARLVAKGYKVAICEQTEDPSQAKGIVNREVVRVITPGTVIENSMLDESKNNYLASVCINGQHAGVCFSDFSTGEMVCTEISGDNFEARIQNEISKYQPKEILLNNEVSGNKAVMSFIIDRLGSIFQNSEEFFGFERAKGMVLKHFNKESLESLDLQDKPSTVCAVGATLFYLYETQKNGLERINQLKIYTESQFMHIDISAKRNLELLETIRTKEKRGSLLWILDKTKTAMGKRLIRSYVEQPLVSLPLILKRLNAVEELYYVNILRNEIGEALSNIYDIERLMTKIVYGTANGRDLKSLSYTFSKLPEVKNLLSDVKSNLLTEIYEEIDLLDDICKLIESAIADEPPVSVREGGLIKTGYNQDVDMLRNDMNGGKDIITSVELSEREKTGIKTLKVGYNRVFGYYIEVSKGQVSQVPETYIRKQTLANCERYITSELKELEGRVLGAQDRVCLLEYQLFSKIREQVSGALIRTQETAHAIAKLDVLISFATTAASNGYVRPVMNDENKIIIKDGRHPVVEKMLEDAPFVPNDIVLDSEDNRAAIITGPNMAGKSTYMRQIALIILMAQIGSFIPASSAEIGVTDSIFTRIGASDDLAAGQSTFMVEMTEVAYILKNATQKSLVVLDEIGRGTSTFDGMSIARAVLEYVCDKKLSAKTLFATHYHELTVLEEQLKGVHNYNIAVKKRGDDITFLRRIIKGPADDSYGIEVAKLAGVPDTVVSRAKVILKQLENEGVGSVTAKKQSAPKKTVEDDMQMTLTSNKNDEVIENLKKIDINTLTPIEAMQVLFETIKSIN